MIVFFCCHGAAINVLKEKPAGTFLVRDSNSFPGAFGLALKVATPPANVGGSAVGASAKAAADPQAELVRHFLIEPTSKGGPLDRLSRLISYSP